MTSLDDCDPDLIAAAILEESSRQGGGLVEIYAKRTDSQRCELGPLGVRSIENRRESGIAVRIWTREGRPGFVHSDAPRIDRVEALVRAARSTAERRSEGPPPDLPTEDRTSPGLGAPPDPTSAGLPVETPGRRRGPLAGSHRGSAATDAASPGNRTESEQPEIPVAQSQDGAALQSFSHRLIGAFSAPGREGIGLLQGWVEIGKTRTLIANGLGGRAQSVLGLVSAGVSVRALEARGGGLAPTVRYAQTTGRLEDLDPERIAAEAAWRAAASIGGEPVSARETTVLLEPRTAAHWIRAVMNGLQEAALSEDHHPQRGEAGRLAVIPGLELIDDPAHPLGLPVPDHDGVGRRVRHRVLVEGGIPLPRAFGSPAPADQGDDPEPMRRDSYRDPPVAGPLKPYLTPGERTREELLQGLDEGLFVASSRPYAASGSASFIAEVHGIWVERGRARGPVVGSLLILPTLASLARIEERGSDLEFDDGGPPIGTPTLRISGALLIAP